MAISQPFVLLLMDYVCGKKLDTKAMLDKIPFFAIAAVFAVITLLTQKSRMARFWNIPMFYAYSNVSAYLCAVLRDGFLPG